MKINLIRIASIAALSAAVAGCAGFASPTNGMGAADYSRYQVRQTQTVQFATVEAVRHIQIQASSPTSNTVGTGVGALAGGVLGNQIGKGRGKTIATILGAITGGVIGNGVEHGLNVVPGLEITVVLRDGRALAITQADGGEKFRRGDAVRIVSGGGVDRVAR